MTDVNIVYKASTTLKKFHKDDSFVKTIIGPIGSGKSVGCIVELMLRGYNQQPDQLGVRRTRFAIIRNTYRELQDTTMRSFFEWVPLSTGHYSAMNMKFTHIQKLPDGTSVEIEFLFRALDRPNDVKKLLSLDLTGGWVNECREIPLQVVQMLQGRCGRFPRTILDEDDPNYLTDPDNARRIYGPTWFGVIMDTNPPDSDHWYYKLFEETIPANHAIYHQPSGLSEQAENRQNLPKGYYKNMMAGKDQEWINVYVNGLYGFIADGKPVYPEYKDDIHSSAAHYSPDPKLPLYIGIDFGLTPAAVFGQVAASGKIVIFDELCTFDMGALSFGRLLNEKINTKYSTFKRIEITADPAGEQRAQTDEITPFLILQNQGIMAVPAYTNDFTIRREAVADYLCRLDFCGEPAFQVTTDAPITRKGFAGGYKYKRIQMSGEARFQDKPDKGRYSHACEACQYLVLGAVGDHRVIGGWDNTQSIEYDNRGIV